MKEPWFQGLNSRGFHRLHYTDRDDAANPHAVICMQGLTGDCRGFDELAMMLRVHVRIIAGLVLL